MQRMKSSGEKPLVLLKSILNLRKSLNSLKGFVWNSCPFNSGAWQTQAAESARCEKSGKHASIIWFERESHGINVLDARWVQQDTMRWLFPLCAACPLANYATQRRSRFTVVVLSSARTFAVFTPLSHCQRCSSAKYTNLRTGDIYQ